MLKSREHQELISMFDREHSHHRLDKNATEYWHIGQVYQDGHVNELFLAYRKGYALGKVMARDEAA